MNELLDLSPEQLQKLKKEQMKILEQKEKFQSIFNVLLEKKKEMFKETAKLEQCLMRLRSYLSTEQTAKFLILLEKVNLF